MDRQSPPADMSPAAGPALTRPEGPEAAARPSRRGLGRTLAGAAGGAALASTYAAAIRPVHAAAIRTPDDGLATGMVRIESGGFGLPAFLARPAGDRRRRPAVIVVSEVFGLHAYIHDVCRRLARAGYVALAPDFFARAGDPSRLTEWSAIRAIVDTANHAQVMGDIAASLAWLERQPFADRRGRGITGFCWGGAVVWMAAAQFPQFKAGVAWYGRLHARDGSTEARPWPLDVAGRLKAPVLGLYAENDSGIPLPTVERMRAGLAAAGDTRSEIRVYPGAQHGFHADYRPQYDPDAAQDGWVRLLSWFARHGLPGARP